MTVKEIIELIIVAPLIAVLYFIAWKVLRNIDL